jgi:proteasome accessory factor C
MEVPGATPTGALASALAKLEAVVGRGSERVPVEIDLAAPPLLDVVQHAVAHGERLAITYFSAGRGSVTERVIAPLLVAHERGEWYVVADCSVAGPERTFRIDRIETAEPTGEHVVPRPVAPPAVAAGPGEDAPLVHVRLPADASWVAERYPVVSVVPGADGRLDVALRVWSTRWLERLLLRAGPGAEVVEPPGMVDVAEAAARVLAVYERR